MWPSFTVSSVSATRELGRGLVFEGILVLLSSKIQRPTISHIHLHHTIPTMKECEDTDMKLVTHEQKCWLLQLLHNPDRGLPEGSEGPTHVISSVDNANATAPTFIGWLDDAREA